MAEAALRPETELDRILSRINGIAERFDKNQAMTREALSRVHVYSEPRNSIDKGDTPKETSLIAKIHQSLNYLDNLCGESESLKNHANIIG